jgi:aspartyl-tRNA(Asn)/glutamyl-tRNA(Gln) amidotransferase subunit C
MGRRFASIALLPWPPAFNLPTMADQKITIEQVRDVAKLARLEIPPERLARLTGQLESILEYVAKIGEVDMTGVEPIAHALPLHNVLRDDVVEPSLSLEKVLQNAPETDGPFFKVPKVIGGDEDSAG